MQVMTKRDAVRIAYFGMLKMLREGGYTLSAAKTNTRMWWVSKEDGTLYLVSLGTPTVAPSCDCPFYAKNEQFHTCKHIQWVTRQLDEEDAEIARREEEHQIADDATAFMEACREEHLRGF